MKIGTSAKFFIIIGLIFFMLLGVFHESVHVQIYRSYGIESKIELFKNFPNFSTTPEKSCPSESCTLAHNINEAITYPLMIFFLLFYFAFLFIIIEIRNLRKER